MMQIMACPDCKGRGKIALFTSSEECSLCGGSGQHYEPISELSIDVDWKSAIERGRRYDPYEEAARIGDFFSEKIAEAFTPKSVTLATVVRPMALTEKEIAEFQAIGQGILDRLPRHDFGLCHNPATPYPGLVPPAER